MNLDFNEIVKRTMRINRLVTIAMLQAILIYAFIAYVTVSNSNRPSPEASSSSLVLIFYALGLISLIASKPLKEMIWAKAPQASLASDTEVAKTAQTYTSGVLCALALCEAPAIFGLILSFQTQALNHYFTLALLAATAIVFHFPRKEHCEAWLRSKVR